MVDGAAVVGLPLRWSPRYMFEYKTLIYEYLVIAMLFDSKKLVNPIKYTPNTYNNLIRFV